jgi:hypothetical protein
MKRISTLLTVIVLMACGTPVLSTAAQTVTHTFVKPKSAQVTKSPCDMTSSRFIPAVVPPIAKKRTAPSLTGSISRPRSTILSWACSGGDERRGLRRHSLFTAI